ncbi:MAG TPA: hemerythrin domain-containing protein [Verrucomicrobiae bacterium]|nr:hemerythrin domain-containing protein [Verrucomicrobiae bacterium]
MKLAAPLMIEHRLIEKMLEVVRREAERAAAAGSVDLTLLDAAVDFIRWYADRTHHAKEEEILFRDLGRRKLSTADRALMDELFRDHGVTRSTVSRLVEAKENYRRGDEASLPAILDSCRALMSLYREHIRKEDTLFFPAALRYLSEPEQQRMLEEFAEADRRMIHTKYRAVVEQYGEDSAAPPGG